MGRVSAAFGLPERGATLEPWGHGDFPTWRLTTRSGAYLVKELAAESDEFPRERFERAMRLERHAIAAGIRTAEPLAPLSPDVGWATKIRGQGWFRAHAWIEHRPVAESDDLAGWLGPTMATLHRLLPAEEGADLTEAGVHPAAAWRDWVTEAEATARPWAGLARRRLGFIDGLTERLRRLYTLPDQVLIHGDIEPNNVLITADGPALIDWDTVWPYPPALQAGRVALRFGGDDNARINAILAAYVRAGGRLEGIGEELFFSRVSHQLSTLAILINVLLDRRSAPQWVKPVTAEQRVVDQLRGLPELVDRLIARARLLM